MPKVKIEVSNRHIHLTKEMYDKLFDEDLNKVKDLSQTGEFASDKVVTLYNENYEINNVRILGPFRSYNQIEISHNDAMKFKIEPPVRASGNLEGALELHVKTPKADIMLPGVIIAQRHIHMNPSDAQKYGVTNGQKVQVEVAGDKSGIMDAYIKISDKGIFVMHIDTDDANSFILKNGDEGNLII